MDSKQISDQINLFTQCNGLPKIELHAHLNGSIRKSTLFELSTEDDREELSRLYSKEMDFENAMEFFRYSSKILKDLDTLRRICREMLEDWNKHNVIYLEIRTTLKSIDGKTKEDYLKTVLEEIVQGNEQYPMVTRLIIALNREAPIEDYLDTLSIYKNFNDLELKKLIVGIDYCGNEPKEKHKYEDVIPIFQQFRDECGLKVTIHMGESKNYQKLDYSVFKPDRIAHTFFFTQEDCEDLIINKIPIEVCPTASYKITKCKFFTDIPFKNYYNKVLTLPNGDEYTYDLISINTDDTMLILSDISQEYFEIASNFSIGIEGLKKFILKGIDFIFETDENVRSMLRKQVENY